MTGGRRKSDFLPSSYSFSIVGGVASVIGAAVCGWLLVRRRRQSEKKDLARDKQLLYDQLYKRVEEFVSKSDDPVSILANTAALVYHELKSFHEQRGGSGPNWVGFYIQRQTTAAGSDDKNEGKKGQGEDRERTLILGPFHGKPAVVSIAFGKGVCGTAAVTKTTQLVEDVHAIENHIACDSASNSEIVVPLLRSKEDGQQHEGREVFGVMDLDSPVVQGFDQRDKEGLERICSFLCSVVDFPSLCSIPYREKKTKKACGG
mmetsp:Transcript_11395/g.18755  ORF Transcript_11395/g.18755 Transcript_11395/m.18755 type:complete len:261 (+) Transcript_11395:123-905(+)